MLFTRSIPPRSYQDYTRYRPLLRKDFQYRCAYCLTHEFYLGGEANFAIDHYRPRHGAFARPDLVNTYTNLYWCCNECNQNKADHHPNIEMESLGKRWINPCESWGDHDLHWHIDANGEVQWLTAAGEYTIKHLLFDRREWLKNHWRQMHALRQQYKARNERLEKLKG